ncbi:serine recombinase [Brevibacillus reuszeri]|uniref:Serine recombinase n=1 Tax=Brevibacillus reuszeri TaxID=54915 RepID=A0A0K9YNI7_9BACL|nr:recombinase family protein [Brevibacillus reuszeri]KNB70236.1 hypothetical protein ADS79_14815 [Brevibacillus reuszeri]MED1859193.1 recombinase family protein [Brevibacillus reuszeri]GED72312.1 serine recombinase [Brevibacillus reuszeri]
MKKRVWALYRVSTERQVTDDDIPMQRNAVAQFISTRPEWSLTKELTELGVSGFKKSVEDRDELQQIKKGAEQKSFDILVVWKDDRLGRKKDEIPFMLEYLNKHGVEVWSVMDGLINKNEHHVDSLISFLRYWSAEGESKKTSERVTEAIKQMNEQGKWSGSAIPYGYEIFDTGMNHPKYDKTIKDIRLSESESKIVKLIFYLVLEKGYGADKIANYLNEAGYKSKNGVEWRSNVVRRILRNPVYTGTQRYNVVHKEGANDNEVKLKPFRDDLVIIPSEVFDDTQKIIDARREKMNEGIVPTHSNNLLLNGIAKCGYCGSKLYADNSTKTKSRKDGTKTSYTYWRYVCRKSLNHRETHPKSYFGAKVYENLTVEKLNGTVEYLINLEQFESLLDENQQNKIGNLELSKQSLEKEKKVIMHELEAVKSLILKIAVGQSVLSEEYVMEQIKLKESEMEEGTKRINNVSHEIEVNTKNEKKIKELKSSLFNWSNKYQECDLPSKKMMVSKLVRSVSFFDKKVVIDYRIDLNELLKAAFKILSK